jgi:hypothetical protein
MRLHLRLQGLLSIAGLCVCSGSVGGQATTASSTVRAQRISVEEGRRLRLDGLLTEPFWHQAATLSHLTQQEPVEGETASEGTEVQVLFDEENLYVGIRALDSEPDLVVSRILQRDRLMVKDVFTGRPAFAGDDAVAILLDPFHDHRNAYVFATNPNGAEFDALLADEGKEFNVDWRGVWEVAGERTGDGWSAEFRIPLRTLRYPNASGASWGFNVYRMIRRKNEKVLWQGWSRDSGGFHRVSLAGHLKGLEGLPPTGRNLELKPYLLGGQRQVRDDAGVLERSREAEVGIDLKTELRPGLVLDLTLNTDFAQVEVDDEQVNLTRFSLFFPEKRDFFLENSGIFDFGVPGNPFEPPALQLFFSRRIGIEEDEDEDQTELVPMLGGARLTGRIGRQTVGFLSAFTDEVEGLVPRESFSVGRVKRDVGENHYVGLMVTDRRSSEEANTVVGVDGAFYLTPSLNLQGWMAHTFTRGDGGDDVAYGITGDFNTDLWGSFVRYMQVGPDAEAKAGFIQRTDLRRTDFFGRRSFRPQRFNIRKIDAYLGGNLFTGVDGTLQDYLVGPVLSAELETGDVFTVFVQKGEARPDEEFDLADTLYVQAGQYDASMGLLILSTSPSRWVVLNGTFQVADLFGGTLRAGGGTLTVSPNPQVSLALGFNRNRVEIPSGSFTADIASLRAGYAFSTRLFTNLLVQYNTLDRYLSTNLRVNFIHRPGSDLFLVLTDEREEEQERGWRLSDRGLVMKVTYLRRF